MNKSLTHHLKNCKIIATTGTCKNAGKTTVLNYLIDCYCERYPIGITSIGYDGEEKDAVTKLPKPRVKVHTGMFVATTIECLEHSEVTYRIKEDPKMMTAMGKIFIVEILTTGILEIAGPSMMSEQEQVADCMLAMGAQKVILDGAAGRLAFAALADGAILSVGAAMSNQMSEVLKMAGYQVELLTLPQLEANLAVGLLDVTESMERPYSDVDMKHRLFRGVLAETDVQQLIQDYLSPTASLKKMPTLVVKDSTAIFVQMNTYRRFVSLGGKIRVLKAIPLKAVTINPMTPYGEWFDEKVFLKAMNEKLDLPVYNIMNEKVRYDDE